MGGPVRARRCLLSGCGISEALREGTLGGGAKKGREGTGSGRLFLLVSLSVGGEAKEDDLGLHRNSPNCSEEGPWATSPGWTWLISTKGISKRSFGSE